MPFDLIAFTESQDASAGALVAAVADRYYVVSGDDITVKPKAPFVLGVGHLAATTPGYLQIRQPSLLVPYYINRGGLTSADPRSQAFTDLLRKPLILRPDEKVNIYAVNATNERTTAVLFMGSGLFPFGPPVRPTHIIRLTGTTTLTANAWTQVVMTLSNDLPVGRYAIVGISVWTNLSEGSPLPIAARLILKDSDWHPGVLAGMGGYAATRVQSGYGAWIDYADPPYTKWPLMPEISFKHDQKPDLEFLSVTADTHEEAFLELVKIQ